MKQYRLGSNGLVYAPGVVAWAKNGYAFKKDRKVLRDVIKGWSGVSDEAADALLSGNVDYEVDGDVVVFEVAERG